MLTRSILIVPFSYNWIKINEDKVVVENFYTKRKVWLEGSMAYLWMLIIEDSSFESIKSKFLEKYSEKILNSSLKKLKSIGLIKIE